MLTYKCLQNDDCSREHKESFHKTNLNEKMFPDGNRDDITQRKCCQSNTTEYPRSPPEKSYKEYRKESDKEKGRFQNVYSQNKKNEYHENSRSKEIALFWLKKGYLLFHSMNL